MSPKMPKPEPHLLTLFRYFVLHGEERRLARQRYYQRNQVKEREKERRMLGEEERDVGTATEAKKAYMIEYNAQRRERNREYARRRYHERKAKIRLLKLVALLDEVD